MTVITVVMRASILFLALSLATAQALTFEEALAGAPERSGVATARIELRDAIINLERTREDPLAVRSDILQAEQRLELARSSFIQTYYAALQEIASAYTGVLQGQKSVAVAQKAAAVSENLLEIAQIRRENGSGTQLDLEEARTSLSEAQSGLRSARDNLNVALNNLETILGRELEPGDLEPIPDDYLVQIPVLPAVLQAAEDHPTVVQAEQGVALSQLNTELLDPSYASRSQIDGAGTGLTNAQEGLRETERSFRIQARNLYNAAESAQETYQVQQRALRNADERLETQRQRFEGGLIARIELSQAELSNLQAELQALQARYGYLTSLLDLQAGTLAPLPGPDALDAPSTDAIEAEASFAAARGETGAAPEGGAAGGASSSGAGGSDTSSPDTSSPGVGTSDTGSSGSSGSGTGSPDSSSPGTGSLGSSNSNDSSSGTSGSAQSGEETSPTESGEPAGNAPGGETGGSQGGTP